MKKQSLLLIGGAVLAFASCQPENMGGGFTQEQVDSIVNVRVAEQMVALQASNDSTINVLAQIKADSIIAAMKGGTSRPSTSTSTGKNTTVNNGGGNKTTNTNTRGGIESQSDQSKSGTRGGIQSQSDQAKSEQKSSGRRGGIQSSSDQSQQK